MDRKDDHFSQFLPIFQGNEKELSSQIDQNTQVPYTDIKDEPLKSFVQSLLIHVP